LTVVLLLFSSVLGIAMSSLNMTKMSGALLFENQPDGSKLSPYSMEEEFVFACWFSVSCFAILNVSVAWVHIALRVQKNR
jgi:hypothetical protein